MLDALPESSDRHEIIDGDLFVTPAPGEAHQDAAGELFMRLKLYLRGSDAAKTMFAPSDVWRGARRTNRVQPDVFAVRRGAAYPLHLRDVHLVVEVASSGSLARDHHVKRDLYLHEGVPEYWVINIDARNVSRWRGRDDPGGVLSGHVEWRMDRAAQPFVLDLPEFFNEVVR